MAPLLLVLLLYLERGVLGRDRLLDGMAQLLDQFGLPWVLVGREQRASILTTLKMMVLLLG
jgi:hypothetical protein